jgi:hypothetical protein
MSLDKSKVTWTIAIIIALIALVCIGWALVKLVVVASLIGGLAYAGWYCYNSYMIAKGN